MKRGILKTMAASVAAIGVAASTIVGVNTSAATADGTANIQLFRDANFNSSLDSFESGVAGITVTLVAPSGASVALVTDADGLASFNMSAFMHGTYMVIVDEDSLPGYLKPGPAGGESNPFVQRINLTDGAEANISIGVVNPQDFCETDALLAINCFVNGNAAEDLTSGYLFGQDSTGSVPKGTVTGTSVTELSSNLDTGSVYGMAWEPVSEQVFRSAYLKRHAGLGPDGIDAIYTTDPASGATSLWYSAIDAGTVSSNVDRGLPLNSADGGASYDIDAFGQVGRVGFGDIDVSTDYKQLFVTNLFDRKVYAIDIAADGTAAGHSVIGEAPVASSDGSPVVPFALEVRGTDLFVGWTSTGEVGQVAPEGWVYKLDLASGAWTESLAIDFGSFTHGKATSYDNVMSYEYWTDSTDYAEWYSNGVGFPDSPYDPPTHVQPIISDLEITPEGYLVVGVRDRSGDQFGHRNRWPVAGSTDLVTAASAGNLLYAAPGASDSDWILESAGVAGDYTSSGTGTTNEGIGGPTAPQGPGGGEFFWNDTAWGGANADRTAPRIYHSETFLGATAMSGSLGAELYASLYDPLALAEDWNPDNVNGNLDAAGVTTASLTTGAVSSERVEFYQDGSLAPPTFGKANGLGDLEMLCSTAPVEIGDVVWLDDDKDGVQDANESPISGVTVILRDADGNEINRAVTDDEGHYYFDVAPFSNYTVDFDWSAATIVDSGESANGAILTSTDSGDADNVDNDAVSSGLNTGTLSVATGAPGENDHAFDVGLVVERYDLALRKNVVDSDTNMTIVSPGDVVVWPIEVLNQGDLPSGEGVTVTDHPGAGLLFVADHAANSIWTDNGDGTYSTVLDADSIAPGDSVTIEIALQVATDASIIEPAALWNRAEISADGGDDIDSTPDGDVENDSQPSAPGDDTDDEVNNTDGDEDDQDIAGVVVNVSYDLAIVKNIASINGELLPVGTNYATFAPGDKVEHVFTIINQGNVTANTYAIEDTFGAGWKFDVDANPDWSADTDNDGFPEIVLDEMLAPGEQVQVTITLTVRNTSVIADRVNLTNRVEIVSDDSATYGTTDIDSTPDGDVDNDNQPSAPGDETDDEVNNANGDEDDHDIDGGEALVTYDWALRKTLTDQGGMADGELNLGDELVWKITVFNQGNIEQRVLQITDVLDPTLTLVEGSDWVVTETLASGETKIVLDLDPAIQLAPGGEASVQVVTTYTDDLAASVASGVVINRAEISEDDSATYGTTDVDSTPDGDIENDNQPANPGDITDDEIDNGEDDEDDQDIAGVSPAPIYDLAVRKNVVDSDTNMASVDPGETVPFFISVLNQGNVVANTDGVGVVVTDYLPTQMAFSELNAEWVYDAATHSATFSVTEEIAALGSVDLPPIYLTLSSDPSVLLDEDGKLLPIINLAEVSEDDSDEYGTTDVDSTPDDDRDNDSQPSNPGDGTDDEVDNADGDEDDHDIAGVETTVIYDLALIKVLVDDDGRDGKVSPGEAFTSRIDVTNQGNVIARNIEVTDYVQSYLTMVDGRWSVAGTTEDGRTIAVANELIAELAPGETASIEIRLMVNQGVKDLPMAVNHAEISNDDGDDVDSSTDKDPENDNQPKAPGDPTDDTVDNTDGDEDDHDITGIPFEPTPDLVEKLAYTGASTKIIVGAGLLLVGMGGVLLLILPGVRKEDA